VNPPQSPRIEATSIFHTFWPLAASWLLMGIELPAISAVVGRLPEAEIMLAAFGGVVFPIALLIESPIIMMLAASATWSRDTESFKQLERFMVLTSLGLTAIAAIVAFTPLYWVLVVPLLDVPEPVQEPALLGLRIMVFWTWAIADRRFRQGALIKFGHRKTIVNGTIVRLCVTFLCLWMLWRNGFSGIVTATVSLSLGVFAEMAFVRVRAASLLRGSLHAVSTAIQRPHTSSLVAFYVPLALTPMLVLAAQPLAAAGITRMPLAIEGLAVWGPLGGLAFLMRSAGLAFNEVVIAHADEPGAEATLRRFAWAWGLGFTAVLAAIALTPLADLWFSDAIGLDRELADMGIASLWLAIPLPILTFLQSHWQGLLVHRHRTRAVTQSVAVFLVVTVALIMAGVLVGRWSGLQVTLLAFTVGNTAQLLWLRHKWRIEGPRRPEQPEMSMATLEPF
jgi:hypothetical protein